ncbi:15828_t:CDS:10 [Acaulospora morrowiae]|uniref:15828_t:CDS:1 n=1 Tax=Acaulospora morrowiae TaxID=94023 RepID=A0A9N8VNS7_9GLOM|nr:15828_t:CDS:10 [Acaulospora morrowiae]
MSCTELSDLDVFSKSDPQVILLSKNKKTRKWEETPHKTEVVMNNLNPKFVKGFVLNYVFEELQELRFIVVDVDKHNNPDWKVQEFVGQCDCDLGSIVGSPGGKVKKRLYDRKNTEKKRGYLIIAAEELSDSRREITLRFDAHDVGIKGFLKNKPNLFFTLSRVNEDNTHSPVYESTEVSSINPSWPEFKIKESTLCNGDVNRALLFEVKNRKKNGEDHPVHGQCSVTLRELLSGDKIFPIKPAPNSSVKIGKDASLRVMKAEVEERPTFLDYIAGGTVINLVVAIDFTSSNGNPRSPRSLHYIRGSEPNDYQRAISSVGKILEAYDRDRLFSVYGFGGKFHGELSHAYPLNDDYLKPEVEGVNGILNVYLRTMKNVELFGPTNFSPVISLTAEKIKTELESGNNDAYYILLIITDGAITDMDSTVRTIIKASSLPLSIVIVGVGDADFTNMNILDADNVPLIVSNKEQQKSPNSGTIKMQRDIVQFVAMRDFESRSSHYLLPGAVLEEIPDQFMNYMESCGKAPRKAIRRLSSELESIEDDEPPSYTA